MTDLLTQVRSNRVRRAARDRGRKIFIAGTAWYGLLTAVCLWRLH